jgi:SlyX protein
MSDQITDLEIQLTHQQHQIEELNELVYCQQQQLDALTAEFRQVKEQLQMGLSSLNRESGEEDPPPHY